MIYKLLFIIIFSLLVTSCAPLSTAPAPTIQPNYTYESELVRNTATATPAKKTQTAPVLTATFGIPKNEKTSLQDSMPQAYIQAGIVRMGGLDIHADERDELPAHDVWLDAFWIDILEVTNGMYMLCVQDKGCTPPRSWASERRPSYFNNEDFKDYPVVHVTWEQANSYCTWAKRRLPSEAEWERAARGDDFRNYPWGDEPPSEHYANFDRLVNDTSRVGSYTQGASPFGALDMAGNVWEWVADYYAIEYYKISPEKNPTGPEMKPSKLRVIRGGSFQDEGFDLRVSKRGAALGPNPYAPHRFPNLEGEHSPKIGFRCASDV